MPCLRGWKRTGAEGAVLERLEEAEGRGCCAGAARRGRGPRVLCWSVWKRSRAEGAVLERLEEDEGRGCCAGAS